MEKIYFNEKTKTYTFSEKSADGELNKNVIPPRFSTQDRLGKYRRLAKKEEKKRELSGASKEE